MKSLPRFITSHLWLILLILILLAGLFVRVYQNNLVPAGFFCDEASIGYNAYKLLTTGADEYGVSWPFFFQAFGDYRLPVPIYSNIPTIAIFGLNEFSVRLTTAIFGSLNILVVFLLIRKVFKNNWLALVSSLFVATSPWHIHFSRFGSEYIYFPFWFCLSLYLFFKGLDQKKWLILSAFSFGISLYTYYPALFTVPLFTLALTSIYFLTKPHLRQYLIGFFLIILVSLLPFISGIFDGTSSSRWQRVSVFNQGSTTDAIIKISSAYLEHFSPQFLFLDGDIDYLGHFITRFSVRGMGELYWIQLPLILFGIYFLIKKPKYHQVGLVFLIWLLLYPLGSALTGTDGGGPFAFRSIFGAVLFQILSALGLYQVWLLLKSRPAKITSISLVILVLLVSFGYYLNLYFRDYIYYSSDFWGWQYGPKPVMESFLPDSAYFDQLILIGKFNSPEIFPKFYDPTDQCQDKCQVGDFSLYSPDKKQLWAVEYDLMDQLPQNTRFQIQQIIYDPNQKPLFFLGQLQSKT